MPSDYRNGMLGTLRSELDDSDSDLHDDFDRLAGLASSARAAFLDFRLKPEKAAELFQMLRLTASDGQEWTVGPTSGAWFSRPVGTAQWFKSAVPIGVTPVYTGESPQWLREGIGDYLVANGDPAGDTRPETLTPFSPGVFNPLAGPASVVPAVSVDQVNALPKPAVSDNDDLEWLESEWSEFDKNLETLRDIRTVPGAYEETPALTVPVLPESLPAGWDADVALTEAIAEEPEIAVREDAAPEAADWQPVDRGGYTSPDTFFLPPE